MYKIKHTGISHKNKENGHKRQIVLIFEKAIKQKT